MRKKIYILIVVIFQIGIFNYSYSQEVDLVDLQVDTINNRVNGKKSGYWSKNYWNGNLKWEGYFQNGTRKGIWKFYTKDGLTYCQGELINGKRFGWWQWFSTKDNDELSRLKYDDKGKPIGLPTLVW